MAGNPNDTLDCSDMPGAGPYPRAEVKRRGHFEKRYLERTPGPWHRTTTLQVRRQLQRCFIDISPMLAELYTGQVVRTAFAEYKWIEADVLNAQRATDGRDESFDPHLDAFV